MDDGAQNPGAHPGQHGTSAESAGLELTGPLPGEIETLAAIAERCQRDPQRHCVYTGADAATIVADVTDIEHWEHRLFVARVAGIDENGLDEKGVVEEGNDEASVAAGWLLADVDHELRRVWWWGPFVDDGHDWSVVADALLEHARERSLTDAEGPTGEEMAADGRSDLFAALAARHGFTAEEGSACLVLHPPESAEHASTAASPGVTIEPLRHEHHAAVSQLHDELFPGTHLTGHGLVMADGDRLARLVAVLDVRVIGYVATELQHDGSLYVDFVGVTRDVTGRGIGRMLVAEACRRGFEHGATYTHLTVRTSNDAALGLYRSLGFDEERILAPYRRGIIPD